MSLRRVPGSLSVVLLAAATVCGCSGDATTATPAAGSSTSAASASASARVALPAKHQWVAAKKAKVQFAAPSTWQVVDAEQASSGVDSINAETKKAFTAIAEAQGVSVEVFFQQVFQQMDLYAASPTKTNGMFDNVNVTRPKVTSMPTKDAVATDLAPLGGKVVSGESVTTPAGDGMRVAYTFPVGDRTLDAQMVFVDNGAEIVQITVTAGSAAAAKALTDTVVSTVSPL